MIAKIKEKIQYYIRVKILHEDPMKIKIEKGRSSGIKIGECCHIYSELPRRNDACLLEIGDNVTISGGVSFFMHDNAISRPTHNEYTDLIGKVVIGNNCFVGYGSIFLPGVMIADDCIIAAGTVVSKSCLETGKVIAGNPCRIIGTVKDYTEKNLSHAVDLKGKSWNERIDYMLNNEQKYIRRKSM